jgi:hypothetical protein
MSRDEPETTIDRWARDNGFVIGKSSGGSARVIEFPRHLVDLWKLDSWASKAAILSQRSIVAPLPLHAAIHRGLWWLERRGIDTATYAGKLSEAGGRPAVLKAIRAYCIETDKTPAELTAGVAILKMINFKRRTKIVVAVAPDGLDA